MEKLMEITFITFRPSSCLEIDIQSVSTIDADRPASFFRHSYFCHHRPRVLHWGASQNMLQYIRLRFALRMIAYPKIMMNMCMPNLDKHCKFHKKSRIATVNNVFF